MPSDNWCGYCLPLGIYSQSGPVEIYSTRTEPEALEALELYLDVAYVLDPFYQIFLKSRSDRVDWLSGIAPDDFKKSEYYAKFFHALDLKDECGVMVTLGDDSALFLSLGVHGKHSAQLSNLRQILHVVCAIARRHWTVMTPQRFEGTGRLAAQLDEAFAAFGSSKLSPREGEIARMVLKGHSSKSIAIAFDNSPETIKVHRKRIYAKLGVASQGELLSLFLTAVRKMPVGGKGDPICYLTE